MAGPSPQSDKQVAWKSLIAGGVAGGIEGFCTYPAEFAKTRLQLQSRSTIGSSIQINKNPLKLLRDVIKNDGFFAIYAGCSAMVIGNTWKAAVRFLTFDQVRNMFKDSKGNISAIGGIFAGFSAGLIESLVAVTPFETIKTALIDDAKLGSKRRYRGFVHGLSSLYRENGFTGIYKGGTSTTLRQCSNQAVRMGTYSFLSRKLKEIRGMKQSERLPSAMTFAIGSIAGVITVYTTMPIDTVKTRMQSLNAHEHYRSTLHCARKVFKDEGVRVFWSGTVPRLARLSVSAPTLANYSLTGILIQSVVQQIVLGKTLLSKPMSLGHTEWHARSLKY